jgi:hypothetical protein
MLQRNYYPLKVKINKSNKQQNQTAVPVETKLMFSTAKIDWLFNFTSLKKKKIFFLKNFQ